MSSPITRSIEPLSSLAWVLRHISWTVIIVCFCWPLRGRARDMNMFITGTFLFLPLSVFLSMNRNGSLFVLKVYVVSLILWAISIIKSQREPVLINDCYRILYECSWNAPLVRLPVVLLGSVFTKHSWVQVMKFCL